MVIQRLPEQAVQRYRPAGRFAWYFDRCQRGDIRAVEFGMVDTVVLLAVPGLQTQRIPMSADIPFANVLLTARSG